MVILISALVKQPQLSRMWEFWGNREGAASSGPFIDVAFHVKERSFFFDDWIKLRASFSFVVEAAPPCQSGGNNSAPKS